MWNLAAIVAVIGLLTTGSGSALLRKVLFQLPGVGLGGSVHTFQKPFFTTLDSAVACASGLLVKLLAIQLHRWRQLRCQGKQGAAKDSGSCNGSGINEEGNLRHKNGQHSLRQPLLDDGVSDSKQDVATRLGGCNDGQESGQRLGGAGAVQQHSAPMSGLGDVIADDEGDKQPRFHDVSGPLIWKLMWPAFFGRAALIIQGLGLKYISASMNQLIAASCIVFTATLSVLFMKRKLNKLHYTGITLTLGGIVIVSLNHNIAAWLGLLHGDPGVEAGAGTGAAAGLAGLDSAVGLAGLSASAGNASALPSHGVMMLFGGSVAPPGHTLGICLVLISQLVQAGQLVLEEALLGGGGGLEPMEVVGWEGLLSIGWMALVFLPAAQLLPGNDVGGVMENSFDSAAMLLNNGDIFFWNFIYWVTVVGTNLYGLMVAHHLGSVFRAVLLAARTGLVWALGLILAYCSRGAVGESWLGAPSWVTLAGFVGLLTGAIIYAQGSTKVVRVHELRPELAPREVADALDDYRLLRSQTGTRETLGIFDVVMPDEDLMPAGDVMPGGEEDGDDGSALAAEEGEAGARGDVVHEMVARPAPPRSAPVQVAGSSGAGSRRGSGSGVPLRRSSSHVLLDKLSSTLEHTASKSMFALSLFDQSSWVVREEDRVLGGRGWSAANLAGRRTSSTHTSVHGGSPLGGSP